MKGDREIRAPPLPSYSDGLINCCISHVTPVSSQVSHACYLQMLLVESLAETPSTNPPKAPAIHKHIPQSPRPCENNPVRISNLSQSLRLSIANPPGSSGASRQGTGPSLVPWVVRNVQTVSSRLEMRSEQLNPEF